MACLLFLLFLLMIGVSDSQHASGRTFCGVNSSVARPDDRGLSPDDGKFFGELHVPIAIFYDDKMFKKVGSNVTELHRFVRAIMKTTQSVYDSDVITRVARLTFHVVQIEQAGYAELHNDADAHSFLTGLGPWAVRHSNDNKWQMAVLLTGVNTKSGKKNNELPREQLVLTGLANLGTICRYRSKATAVVEARNFNSAYVLAHEIAHSFDIGHDGDPSQKGCSPDHNIMSPSTGEGKVSFSQCSAQSLRYHLSGLDQTNKLHKCFGRPPTGVVPGFENLRSSGNAGDVYNATEQCRFSFGPAYEADFTAVSSICPMLYCVHNFWQVKSHPALPGTVCGSGGNRRCDAGAKCQAFNQQKEGLN